MTGSFLLYDILGMIISAIVMLVIIQFIIGLLFAFNVVSSSNDFLFQVYRSINSLLEPILRPIRRIMPATGTVDFSPLVLVIGLSIIQRILFYTIAGV